MKTAKAGVEAMTDAAHLERIFAEVFFSRWNTLLEGGGDEPVYLPATGHQPHHRIIYRDDYFASALHETAHWCIAGERRRQLVDFGYWYNPDGRDRDQQRAFEQVEVRPQALEWIFTSAAGRPFQLSADNLASSDPDNRGPSPTFAADVLTQVRRWCVEGGMPERGTLFARALAQWSGAGDPLDPARYGYPE